MALHDCNRDVNKAINIPLEGHSDTTSWETVGGKNNNFGRENKENKEKRTAREASHTPGNNHKGKADNRGPAFKGEENGTDCSQGNRPLESGKWPEAEDLEGAGKEGQESSLLKAWGHSVLQTIQSPCLQMTVGQSW